MNKEVIPVTVDIANAAKESIDLVLKYFPTCIHVDNNAEIIPEIIQGGITNCLIRLYCKNDKHSSVLIRIFGLNTEQIINRSREKQLVEHMSACGVGKSIIGFFLNGQVEEWVGGRTIECSEMRHPYMVQRIAQSLARLHSIPIPSFLCESAQNNDSMWETLYSWLVKIHEMKQQAEDPRLALIDTSAIKKGLDELKKTTDAFNLPIVVCHNDLLNGNIIEKRSGEVCFIDYEYGNVGCFLYDIANHLCEYIGPTNDRALSSTPEDESFFLECYLSSVEDMVKQCYTTGDIPRPSTASTNCSRGIDPQTINETSESPVSMVSQISPLPSQQSGVSVSLLTAILNYKKETLLTYLPHYKKQSCFLWGLWALLQMSSSKIQFDYFSFALQRLSLAFSLH